MAEQRDDSDGARWGGAGRGGEERDAGRGGGGCLAPMIGAITTSVYHPISYPVSSLRVC